MEPTTEDVPHRIRQRLGQKTYDFLLNTAKLAGVLSLAYGVGFGVFQYYESKQEKRVEETLSLFRQFNNPPYTEYRKHVDIALEANAAELANAAGDEAQLAAAFKRVMQKEQAESDIAFIFNFFDTVVYCASKNICDPDITFDLFHASAHRRFAQFYQYIQAQRSSDNEYGAGAETLVKLESASANSSGNASGSGSGKQPADVAVK